MFVSFFKFLSLATVRAKMPEAGGCGKHEDLLVHACLSFAMLSPMPPSTGFHCPLMHAQIIRDQNKNDLAKKIETCDLNPNDMFDHAKLVQVPAQLLGLYPAFRQLIG